MPEEHLIEIRVRLSSKAHRVLTRRAEKFGIDREIEAGRLLHKALISIFQAAERSRREQAARDRLAQSLRLTDDARS